MAKKVTCYDIDGQAHEVSAAHLQWRPSAYAIVVRDGQLLTAKHFKRHNLPGGGINLGETPIDAVMREVTEETGMQVANPRFITATTQFFAWKSRTGEMKYYQTILLYYLCDLAGGSFSMDGFDDEEKVYAEMPEWYPLDRIDDLSYTGAHDWRPIVKRIFLDEAVK